MHSKAPMGKQDWGKLAAISVTALLWACDHRTETRQTAASALTDDSTVPAPSPAPAPPPFAVGVSLDPGGPLNALQPVTFTAATKGIVSEVEYRFLINWNGTWSVAQDYGSSNRFTYTPADAGSYAMQVWARRRGATADYEAWSGSQFAVGSLPLQVVSLQPDVLSPTVGAPQTWTTQAAGGKGPRLYRFWIRNPLSGWQVLQEYSTSNTFTWVPREPGSHSIQVWVKSSGSTSADYDAWKGYDPIPVQAGNAPAPEALRPHMKGASRSRRSISAAASSSWPQASRTPRTGGAWTARPPFP